MTHLDSDDMSRWIHRILVLAGLGVIVWAILRQLESDEPATSTGPAAWPPLRMAESDAATPSPVAPGSGWVEPDGGSCPISHPVKGNLSSGIYHVAGGRFYDRTKAERCYADPAAAEADGLRASKS